MSLITSRPRAAGAANVGREGRRGWTWAAGGALGAAVLGPALVRGPVFALDAAFVSRLPVPAGIWGLGPELPRRVPLGVALAWASTAVGAVAGPLLLAVAVAVAFVGAARLVGEAPWVTRLAAGLLFSASPLVLTRVGAGQWTAVAPFALLPWALPSLLRPGDRPAATFGWAAALGCTGSVGGTLALVAAATGVVAERRRASLVALALVALAQVPWVVPALVVSDDAARPAGAEAFATRADGPAGALGVLAGHGFWRPPSQVGGDTGPGVALLAAGLLGLAALGAGSLPAAWRWRAVGLAGVGLALALASAVPGARDLYGWFSRTWVGAPFRESQRFAVLTLVWLAPAAALGGGRLAAEPGWVPAWLTRALPAVVALVLAVPGLWGVGGRLRPSDVPGEWARARAIVGRSPGPVLALPYRRYLDLPVAGGRRVLNPIPDYFGGDVLSSSDPGFGTGAREGADPREPTVLAALARVRAGQPVGDGLVRAGVRWVVLLRAADWRAYGALGVEPGLRPVIEGPGLTLWAVVGWRGSVVDDLGAPAARHALVAPFQRLAPSPAAVWAQPAAAGWMRGGRGSGRTAAGLVRLPGGRGPLWYWPALVVVAGDALVVVALGVAWRYRSRSAVGHRRLADHPAPVGDDSGQRFTV